MKNFLIALQFLTIIKLSRKIDITEENLGISMSYFPVVGLCIGLVLVLARWSLAFVLPSSVVDVLVIAILVVLTGALHLDGFADTVDGLAGRGDREKTLAIMRDSKIGTFAVVGITLILLLKTTSLASLPLFMKDKSLLLMAVLGRWATVPLAAFFPYARAGHGTALAFSRFAGIREVIIASLIALGIAVRLLQYKGLIIFVAVALVSCLLGLFFKSRIGGVTGDIMGAACEVSEIVVLFMISGMFH
jgi:adenosylcobinamide-GDP ribazoletransferase